MTGAPVVQPGEARADVVGAFDEKMLPGGMPGAPALDIDARGRSAAERADHRTRTNPRRRPMKPRPPTDPTGYRAVYDRLIRGLPGASRPTKAEFAKAIMEDKGLWRLFVVVAATRWVDQQQTVGDGRGNYRRRSTETRQT